MNKLGIAVIVGVVFLILLSSLSVGGIWFFINLSLKKSTSAIGNDCFTVDLEPIKCEAYGSCGYDNGRSGYRADVTVKRNAGKADLTGLRFAFENDLGKVGVVDRNVNSPGDPGLNELESIRYCADSGCVSPRIPVPVGYPLKLDVAPIVGGDNLCKDFKESINCLVLPENVAPDPGFVPGPSNTENDCCMYPWNLAECSPSSVGVVLGKVRCCNAEPLDIVGSGTCLISGVSLSCTSSTVCDTGETCQGTICNYQQGTCQLPPLNTGSSTNNLCDSNSDCTANGETCQFDSVANNCCDPALTNCV